MAATAQLSGLSHAEAAARLAREGRNELPKGKKRNPLAVFWDVLKQPMFLLLLAAGALYMLLGEPREAIPLVFAVLIIILIEFFQERRTERALEALREIGQPTARVIREGEIQQIPAAELVREDLIVLSEGERVPADAVMILTTGVSVDESLLTGESVPISKRSGASKDHDDSWFFSGTLVTTGHAIAGVEAVGQATRIGKIGSSLQRIVPEEPLLRLEINRLVRFFGSLGLSICLLIVVLYGLMRGEWLQGVLAAVTAAISLIPEEFPVVLSIFLALGAWRIARYRVLARNTQAIETLGAATVLCVDKTGTITMNQMTIKKIVTEDGSQGSGVTLSSSQLDLLSIGVLASKERTADPMEAAFHRLARQQPESFPADLRLVKEYPLTPQLLSVVHVWEQPFSPSEYLVATKGAPEAIAALCRMNDHALADVLRKVEQLATDGLRVLGVAKAVFPRRSLPTAPSEFPFEFLGLVGFEDPVRPGVPEAMRECYSAGVRVMMMTGDHPATALKVAQEVGIRGAESAITGKELESIPADHLDAVVREQNVFARVRPEHKLLIVEALKSQGAVVAMTGDGVNDAPALKAAHIGIAMGKRGTDVAREASSLVLLDDDFTSIVCAIRAGRRVYDNLRRAIAYIVALHIPLAGLATMPLIFGWPLLVFPLHILFFEFVTDPACAIVFEAEPEAPDLMARPPRPRTQHLLTTRIFSVAVLQGSVILAGVLGIAGYALRVGRHEDTVRALAITALILANVFLILVNRSWTQLAWRSLGARNPSFWIISVAVVVALFAIFLIQPVREAFKFSPITWTQLVWCMLASVVVIGWFEALKLIHPQWSSPRGK